MSEQKELIRIYLIRFMRENNKYFGNIDVGMTFEDSVNIIWSNVIRKCDKTVTNRFTKSVNDTHLEDLKCIMETAKIQAFD